MFTVDDLKPGYRVVLHNGSVGIYVLEGVGQKPYIYGEYGEKLTKNIRFYDGRNNNGWDDPFTLKEYMIVKVYKEAKNSRYWTLDDKELLWEYPTNKEAKEMTIKEIEDKLGYRIRIVG